MYGKVSLEEHSKSEERYTCRKLAMRPAHQRDALVVSYLMYYSDPKLALYLFGEPENNVIRVFRDLFQVPSHIFSYTQAFVVECDGKVVGSIFGLDGKMRKALELAMIKIGFRWFKIIRFRHIPHMIRAIIDLERITLPVLDEDYYVYMLAVLPNMRGRGIGTQLIKLAEAQARSKELKMVVLDVEINNKNARHFYELLGYQVSKIVIDSGFFNRSGIRGAVRMVKPINPV